MEQADTARWHHQGRGIREVRLDDPLGQRAAGHRRRPNHDLSATVRVLEPALSRCYPIMGALGTALVGFNILALVMILIPYRRGERWAWFTLWMLPLLWLSQFVFSPDLLTWYSL